MKYPDPAPGLVIRYAFLWSSEHEQAIYEAAKDRPCAIVLAAKIKDSFLVQTVVVPITHSKPADGDPTASLEIPREICKKLGLDGERHWVRLTELNRFVWPGYDLRERPDASGRVDYGFLPEAFFEQIRSAIVARSKMLRLRFTPRDQ
ncbi:hypothetical protein [Rhizobium sp. BR 362]|uniref:hypothetical protein n=1 Tax=Rhizobium sp. BR 362 TaxID=3040670 RepID=UPI002F3E9B99